MIEGCLDWQENGLVRPESVTEATEAYFAEQDLMSQWLADECMLTCARPTDGRQRYFFESWSLRPCGGRSPRHRQGVWTRDAAEGLPAASDQCRPGVGGRESQANPLRLQER